jgi:hypothetical protein
MAVHDVRMPYARVSQGGLLHGYMQTLQGGVRTAVETIGSIHNSGAAALLAPAGFVVKTAQEQFLVSTVLNHWHE